MSSLEETLLAQAQRQFDQQVANLESLRNRAVSVLGIGGVVAGLFVGRLDARLNGYSWAALALFLLTVLCAVFVVVPRGGPVLSEDLRSAFDWYQTYGRAPQATEAYLIGTATNLNRDNVLNRRTLRAVTTVFATECVLLGVQMLLWVLGATLH
jgi:hypothetical protein